MRRLVILARQVLSYPQGLLLEAKHQQSGNSLGNCKPSIGNRRASGCKRVEWIDLAIFVVNARYHRGSRNGCLRRLNTEYELTIF